MAKIILRADKVGFVAILLLAIICLTLLIVNSSVAQLESQDLNAEVSSFPQRQPRFYWTMLSRL